MPKKRKISRKYGLPEGVLNFFLTGTRGDADVFAYTDDQLKELWKSRWYEITADHLNSMGFCWAYDTWGGGSDKPLNGKAVSNEKD